MSQFIPQYAKRLAANKRTPLASVSIALAWAALPKPAMSATSEAAWRGPAATWRQYATLRMPSHTAVPKSAPNPAKWITSRVERQSVS